MGYVGYGMWVRMCDAYVGYVWVMWVMGCGCACVMHMWVMYGLCGLWDVGAHV